MPCLELEWEKILGEAGDLTAEEAFPLVGSETLEVPALTAAIVYTFLRLKFKYEMTEAFEYCVKC